MADRVVLFIDAQNVYRGARECFFGGSPHHHFDGQIDPIAVGSLISSRPPEGTTRELHEVRVYTGRPASDRQPRAYAAHMRQCAAWERSGAIVVPRTLRYPRNWPDQRAQEKGIDVQLAVDFVAGAIDGTYDAGIISRRTRTYGRHWSSSHGVSRVSEGRKAQPGEATERIAPCA